MSNIKKKLDFIRTNIDRKKFDSNSITSKLSTKQKLEELVNKNLKNRKLEIRERPVQKRKIFDNDHDIHDFIYPLEAVFGKVTLNEWDGIKSKTIATVFNNPQIKNIDPRKLLFFDTETTGLSGGTGTIPFMLGFGYIENRLFKVKIFILNDPAKEGFFLEEVDKFLHDLNISGVVTYNGKSFDYPLMETRYILNRKKFPLLAYNHLDFLFPARTIWRNTYESRKLGYLGDVLLNISREDDIDGSLIPRLYFEYLRTGDISMIEKVIEHNALDIVGLSALLLLGCKYVEDYSRTTDDGEILGVAQLNEKCGIFSEAEHQYQFLIKNCERENIVSPSLKKLANMKKKKKLFEEAKELWKALSDYGDGKAMKEMSMYLEHREKDFSSALRFVHKGLERSNISEKQREDFEKRLVRLQKKIKNLLVEN